MKLDFIFSDPATAIKTSLSLPEAARQQPDCKERVLAIAASVGALTQAGLHIDCPPLGLRQHPVKRVWVAAAAIRSSFHDTLIRFERYNGHFPQRQHLKIIAPVTCPIPYATPASGRQRSHPSLERYLIRPEEVPQDAAQALYTDHIHAIIDNCLVLLNAEAATDTVHAWKAVGFHPAWLDKRAVTRAHKQAETERRRAHRAARRQASPPTALPQPVTGAGRRPGAIPGVFQGILMRSQLEIRFAAELEKRGIHWVYEAERLGEEQYLVDFYLPDAGCWVEVKGAFEARDDYQLPKVAAYLRRERKEKLLVYSQSKAYLVNRRGFRRLSLAEFWASLT